MSKERTEGQLYFLNYTDSDRASSIMVTKIFTVHALVNNMFRMGAVAVLTCQPSERKSNGTLKPE